MRQAYISPPDLAAFFFSPSSLKTMGSQENHSFLLAPNALDDPCVFTRPREGAKHSAAADTQNLISDFFPLLPHDLSGWRPASRGDLSPPADGEQSSPVLLVPSFRAFVYRIDTSLEGAVSYGALPLDQSPRGGGANLL